MPGAFAIDLCAAVADTIAATARAAPREIVGTLAGRPTRRGFRVLAFDLLAAATTDRDGFTVAAATFAASEARLRDRGLAWLGFVHSHPEGEARLSQRDRVELWRHCLQVVVAPRAAGPRWRAFVLHDDRVVEGAIAWRQAGVAW